MELKTVEKENSDNLNNHEEVFQLEELDICYCDCTNEKCGRTMMVMSPDDWCPECESEVKPSTSCEMWVEQNN